jgi:hypothetical protein
MVELPTSVPARIAPLRFATAQVIALSDAGPEVERGTRERVTGRA